MPDSNQIYELQELVANSQACIKTNVIFACRKYNHGAPPDEVEELTEQINLLLLEDDCRRLKTYDRSKAKFSTWLQNVVNYHASRYYQKHPHNKPIEELHENQFSVEASQENEILMNERRKLLEEAINQLTWHDQKIAQFKLNGTRDEEIALKMNVKIRSIQQEWVGIIKKIKAILNA